AHNAKRFSTWNTYQGSEPVAFSNIRADFKTLLDQVFDLSARFTRARIDKVSSGFTRLLDTACDSCPGLFSDAIEASDCLHLLDGRRSVFSAWDRLRRL
ncbi:hypothetical protein K488DRAFT_25528, partial [Vararia minispora EC-137]